MSKCCLKSWRLHNRQFSFYYITFYMLTIMRLSWFGIQEWSWIKQSVVSVISNDSYSQFMMTSKWRNLMSCHQTELRAMIYKRFCYDGSKDLFYDFLTQDYMMNFKGTKKIALRLLSRIEERKVQQKRSKNCETRLPRFIRTHLLPFLLHCRKRFCTTMK